MALSTTLLESDLDYIMADIVQRITFNGTSYSAVVGDISNNNDLEMAGYRGVKQVEIHININDFSTAPAIKDKLTYNSIVYRVVSIDKGADGFTYILRCQEESA